MDPGGLFRYTHLARPLNLKLVYTRMALLLSGWFCLAGLSFFNRGFRESALASLAAGLFWALGREISPDWPSFGTLSLLVGGFTALIWGTQLGPILVLMLAVRVLVRTTGLPPTNWDRAALLALGTGLAYHPWGLVSALTLAVALYLDAELKEPAGTAQRIWAASLAIGASVLYSVGDLWDSWEIAWEKRLLVLALALWIMLLCRKAKMEVVGDLTDQVLDHHRHYYGLILSASSLAVAGFMMDTAQLTDLIGLGTVLFAAAIYIKLLRLYIFFGRMVINLIKAFKGK